METLTEIKNLIKEIKELDKKFEESRNQRIHKVFKKEASQARRKIASLMETDYLVVDGLYLYRQTHAWGQTVAIYTPEMWNRREEYLKGKLDWIK